MILIADSSQSARAFLNEEGEAPSLSECDLTVILCVRAEGRGCVALLISWIMTILFHTSLDSLDATTSHSFFLFSSSTIIGPISPTLSHSLSSL